MKKIELEKVFIELLEDDIVLLTAKDNSVIEILDVKEIKAINLRLTKGKDYAVIVDAQNHTSISEEARAFMVTESIEKKRKAIAIIIYELPQRIVGNFYIKFNKPACPTKLFSNKTDAIIWVKKYLCNY